jgi:hypothetical protein
MTRNIKTLTDSEVVAELQSESVLNKIRQEFSFGYARIEQAYMQRTKPGIIEARRMELEIAQKILDICVAHLGQENN